MNEEITLTDDQLRSIQLIQVELLLEVDRLCRLHDINYTMLGGTMLGAVRHKGYIPWDDDADIGMLRAGYEKFRDVCVKDLDSERFYFQDIDVTPGYRWGYGKLRRNGTLFQRSGQEHMPYEQGIFVDIFPLDNVPDGYINGILHSLRCYIIRKILWSEVGKFTAGNLFLRTIYSLLNNVSLSLVKRHMQELAAKYNGKPCKKVRIITMFSNDHCSEGLRSWFEDTVDYEFEGHLLKGVRDFDGYLRLNYDDYMALPPENDRTIHPVSKLRLFD